MLSLALIVLGGLVVGLSLGVLGGGGTTLTLPILLLLGLEPKPAIALSLAVVAATAATAAAFHARAGQVDWRAAAAFAPASGLGGYAGGRAAAWVPGETLLLIFTGLMVAAGIAMLRSAPRGGGARARPLVLGLQGVLVGALTGLVGAGGGFLFVPALALLGGLTLRRAVGTSLVVISANAVAALIGHLGHVALPLGRAAALAGAAVAGAGCGARLSRRAPEARLRRVLGVVVLLVAAWMLARSPLLLGLLRVE